MKVRQALIFDSLVLVVVAVGCFFDMPWARTMFGIPHSENSVFICQLLGAAVFGLALQNWLARNIEIKEKQRIILLANFLGHGVACFILLMSHVFRAGTFLGWLPIGYTFLATILFGYFLDGPQVQSQQS